jgi:hypothetical protein
MFTILYICLLQIGVHLIANAVIALMLTGSDWSLLCVAIKKLLVGDKWGADATPFWSWRHFAYFFAQDCFFVLVQGTARVLRGTILSSSILRGMGCRIGLRGRS